MKVPDKLESLHILIRIDSNDRKRMEAIAHGLIVKVNHEFMQQGYCVEDAFGFSSENGFKEEFYISVNPQKENGDSLVFVVDEEKAKQHACPTLEILTVAMIKAIRQREGLPFAYVRRSEILGLGFLENYVVKDDTENYILKWPTIKDITSLK